MIDIDIFIVFLFLAITLATGLYYGYNVKTVRDYSIGDKRFSTPVLVSTITATYISGSSLMIAISYAYQDGILKLLSTSGIIFGVLMVSHIFVPRMHRFFGNISVGDVMRDLFGSKVQVITAVAGIFSSLGLVAMQLKILSVIFAYFTHSSSEYSLMICTFVLITYSYIGGIRAVAFTDVIQLITFIIILPIILLNVCSILDFGNNPHLVTQISDHILKFEAKSGVDYLTIFLLFLIPANEPATMQRILLGKSIKQAKKSFSISAIFFSFYYIMATAIGILLYMYDPNVNSKDILPFLIENFTSPGLTGLLFVAIIAMAMSTADSHLNCSSVLFSHDFCKPIFRSKLSDKAELLISRLFLLILGIGASILAFYFQDLLSILLFTKNFYMPIVSVPLTLAIMGYKSNTQSVLIGMFAGFFTVLLWMLKLQEITGFNSLVPGVIANFIFLVMSNRFLVK